MNAPLDATIHITPKKGETASSSSAVENLQQIYSGELVKFIPLAERGKILNRAGLKKFSQTPFVDASGDAAVFLKAKAMQGKVSTQDLLTQILQAKTLDEAMRASLKQGLTPKERTSNVGTLSDFFGGLVAHADSTNFSASGSGWVIQADGNFTATSDQANDYFINDPSGDGGGWVLAPNGRYYPSYCIDIADGGANESSSYVLNTVNNGNNGLTSGTNAGNIANLLPSDPTGLNDLMDLLYATTEVALAGNSQGVDVGTAQNLTANVGVIEQAINAAHGTFGYFAKMTDGQIMTQSTWAGTWIGDNWSKIMAQMTSNQKNAQGTAGPSATSNELTIIGMGNADTGIKAPDASSLSEKLPLKSSDGNAELYVGDNGNLWVKALKPTNGTVTFPKIETKGTAGTSLGTAPFYIADKANNAEGAGLQTRLSPVGLFKAGTPALGTINVSIKMLAMGENKGQKAQIVTSYPTGLSQAGAVLEVENVATGKRLKATGSMTFVATAPVMTVKVPVKLDASGLAGHDLVTMEDLYIKDVTTKKDIKVAQFRDKNAASETVHVEKPTVPQTPQSPQTPKSPLQVLTSVLPKTGDKGGGLLVLLGALMIASVAVLKRKAFVSLKRKLRRKLKK